MKPTPKAYDAMYKSRPFVRFQVVSVIAAAICIVFGFATSIICQDWGQLSRSGALLVVVGVFVAYHDFSGNILKMLTDHNADYYEMEYIAFMAYFKLTGDKQSQEQFESSNERRKQLDTFTVEFAKVVKKRLRKIEATCVIMGTIIWAYADIIAAKIWPLAA